MAAGQVGDAMIGNQGFALTLENAPKNYTQAILALGIGGCGPGIGLGFCAPVRIALAPQAPLLAFFGPAGPSSSNCGAGMTLPTPIPMDSSLCKLQLSVQWLVQCSGNPIGHGVSDCLTLNFK